MNKQEILNKIEKIEKELAEFKQELNGTEEEWIPKIGKEYWYYDKDIEAVDYSYWDDDKNDNTRLKNKVIFKTKAEAQRYADYQKVKEEYSYEFSKEEWESGNDNKYKIVYNHYDNKLETISNGYFQNLNNLYFKTESQAQEFIDKYKAEILEFEFGIKEEK